MPTSGSDILSYKGSGGLGFSADIPAVGTKDLEVVNNTLDRVQAQNSMRNQQIFAQKIKDRDALIAAIDSGDIKVGDLREQDMPIVKEGLEKLDEAYFNRIKKGVNDIDAAREYKKALRDAQDRVTQAQMWKKTDDELTGAIAKETLPRKQEAMKQHLEKLRKGGFWADNVPYQQTLDADIQKNILGTAAFTTESFTDKNNPLIKGKKTFFDYPKTRQNNIDKFLEDGDARHDQQFIMSELQKLPPAEFLKEMEAINNRIKEHNAERGLTAGQPGFVEEVPFAINKQTGQNVISEKVPDFAAKYTLAHQKPFGSVETEFDSKLGSYLIGKQKADTDAVYKRAMAGAAGTRARAYADNIRQQMKLRNTEQEKDQFLDEMYRRNFVEQPSLITEAGGKKNWLGTPNAKMEIADIKAQNSLPVFTLEGKTIKQLVPIGATPVYATDAYDKDGELKPSAKPLRYEGGYYKPTYRLDGKEVNADRISEIYTNFKKQQTDWSGSLDDFLKQAVASGKLNVLLTGANGTTDEQLSKAAQRIIANQGTKKGQELPFSIEYSEDLIPDNNQE